MVWTGGGTRRLAKSLITLIDEVDAKYPDRDRSNDGTIGDTSHQARRSDHNPDSEGVVRALDITTIRHTAWTLTGWRKICAPGVIRASNTSSPIARYSATRETPRAMA